MIVPNKAITYSDSLLSRFPGILDVIGWGGVSVLDLYYKTHDKFENISQFILALEVLFVLRKIEMENGEIKRC